MKTKNEKQKSRALLKFDTGADGFLKMIYVLFVTAFLVLGFGIYFLAVNFS
jgi:cell division protein FtsL